MIVNATEPYTLIPVLMILTYILVHRFTRKPDFVIIL